MANHLIKVIAGTATALVLSGYCVQEASAAIVAQYNFGQAGPHTTAPNVTASNVTQSNMNTFNVGATSSSYGSGTNPFLAVAPNISGQSDPAGAYANNQYWTFTLSPSSGYQINLDDIQFTVFRGGASGTRGFAVYSSVDSYASALLTVTNESGTRSSPRSETITLSSSFDALTSPVTFRFYIHSLNNASTVEFDSLTLNGEVSLIPEPASLLTLGSFAGLLMRRRRA